MSRIAHLGLAIHGRVEGTSWGSHRSQSHGASVEFAQHRAYTPGDDVRHLDWKVYAKSDRYAVKVFEDETNLQAILCVDISGSMHYARPENVPTKVRYASQLAAALAWLLLEQGDRVGLLTFNDALVRYAPPSAQKTHFWQLIDLLEHIEPQGKTVASQVLSSLGERLPGRSVVMLFSDCFEFTGRLAAAARQLHHQQKRVIVFQVLDPSELDFPFDDLTAFEGLEDEGRVLVDPRGIRKQYINEINKFCKDLELELEDGGVEYIRVSTAWPVEQSLLKLLGDRS